MDEEGELLAPPEATAEVGRLREKFVWCVMARICVK